MDVDGEPTKIFTKDVRELIASHRAFHAKVKKSAAAAAAALAAATAAKRSKAGGSKPRGGGKDRFEL